MTKRSEPPSFPPNKVEVIDCSVQLSEDMKVLHDARQAAIVNIEAKQTQMEEKMQKGEAKNGAQKAKPVLESKVIMALKTMGSERQGYKIWKEKF